MGAIHANINVSAYRIHKENQRACSPWSAGLLLRWLTCHKSSAHTPSPHWLYSGVMGGTGVEVIGWVIKMMNYNPRPSPPLSLPSLLPTFSPLSFSAALAFALTWLPVPISGGVSSSCPNVCLLVLDLCSIYSTVCTQTQPLRTGHDHTCACIRWRTSIFSQHLCSGARGRPMM